MKIKCVDRETRNFKDLEVGECFIQLGELQTQAIAMKVGVDKAIWLNQTAGAEYLRGVWDLPYPEHEVYPVQITEVQYKFK